MTNRLLAIAMSVAAFSLAPRASAQQKSKAGQLTIDNLIEIKHPSNPLWSPDGLRIAFLWERAGVTNLYVADPEGKNQPIALTNYPEGDLSGVFWSPDSQSLYFPRDGDLWRVSRKGGSLNAVWTTPAVESNIVLSPDGKRLAFVRSNPTVPAGTPSPSDLVVRSLAEGAEMILAHDGIGLENVSWSPDSSHISYLAGSKIVHHDETPPYSGSKIIFAVPEYVPGQVSVVPAGGGKAVAIRRPTLSCNTSWVGSGHLALDCPSEDYKKRTIYLADIDGNTLRPLHEDIEEKFWSIPDDIGASAQASPDGRWIAFLSDLDGWDHLYVMPAAGGDAVQITKGKFEAWRPSWSPDSTKIAFDANEPDHYGDRHLGVANIGNDPAHAAITMITTGHGTDTAPLWSPDGKHLIVQHTDPHNSADLFVVDSAPPAKRVRLTDSMPASIDRSAFVEPEVIRYPGPDGQQVPAWLFVPKNLDRSKKHPAVIWIHGDGINQNYDGWHIERNYAVYYSFHQYLLQQGYVVIAPDYRGSIGYGRDWRTGVYMDVGGNDAKDAWMAANYLKTLKYVDSERIGVWGLSYGGFFTLIAVTDQPKLFRAGVDVAGVVDFGMYYTDPYHGDWLTSRLGTPEQHPDVYARTAPINHIDRLKRPLLVLHGTPDENVPFLESVRLIDQALKQKKGNLLSFMMYPGEFHYFRREHVLRDAWHRVDDFFRLHLVEEKPPAD